MGVISEIKYYIASSGRSSHVYGSAKGTAAVQDEWTCRKRTEYCGEHHTESWSTVVKLDIITNTNYFKFTKFNNLVSTKWWSYKYGRCSDRTPTSWGSNPLLVVEPPLLGVWTTSVYDIYTRLRSGHEVPARGTVGVQISWQMYTVLPYFWHSSLRIIEESAENINNAGIFP